MKKIIAWALAFVTFLVIAASLDVFGAEVKLAWDTVPVGTWDTVRVYEKTGTAPAFVYVQVAEVPGNQTQATVPNVLPGVHTYVARGVKTWESPNSNEAVTPGVPPAPTIRITINVTVGD